MGSDVWIPEGADYLVTREGHLLLLPARNMKGWAALTEMAQSYGLMNGPLSVLARSESTANAPARRGGKQTLAETEAEDGFERKYAEVKNEAERAYNGIENGPIAAARAPQSTEDANSTAEVQLPPQADVSTPAP